MRDPKVEEAKKIATHLNSKYTDLICDVEEDLNGNVYIRVLAEPGVRPDLSKDIPAAWEVLPWNNPESRGELTSIFPRLK